MLIVAFALFPHTSWDIPTQHTRTLFLPFTSLSHLQIWLKYHTLPMLHSLGSCLKGQGRRQQGSHSSIPFYDIGSKRTHGLLRWSHCRCRSCQVHSRSQGNGQNHSKCTSLVSMWSVGHFHIGFTPHHQRWSHHSQVHDRQQCCRQDHVRPRQNSRPGGGWWNH